MRTEITAGQTSDYLGFDLVMADNLPTPSVLLADRGYDADSIRETMDKRNVLPVIPMRKSRKKRVGVDRSLYRLRNLVERCFNKLKNARRVATRYDKTAESFLGFIDITSIRLWLRHLSTVSAVPAPRCSAYPVLRDLAHLTVGSAFRNVHYKFVSQIVGRGDLRVGSPAVAG